MALDIFRPHVKRTALEIQKKLLHIRTIRCHGIPRHRTLYLQIVSVIFEQFLHLEGIPGDAGNDDRKSYNVEYFFPYSSI